MKIAVINYQGGNVGSVFRAFEFLTAKSQMKNVEVFLANSPADLRKADRVVIPGQGAFPQTMNAIHANGLDSAICESFGKKPTLGICVGMQILFDRSDEGNCQGLGLIKGEVLSFSSSFAKNNLSNNFLKVPNMGWSKVNVHQHPLWKSITNPFFYFAHSYFCKPIDTSLTIGETTYGINYSSAIASKNFFAVQFHPEKSGIAGLQFLENFINLDF